MKRKKCDFFFLHFYLLRILTEKVDNVEVIIDATDCRIPNYFATKSCPILYENTWFTILSLRKVE